MKRAFDAFCSAIALVLLAPLLLLIGIVVAAESRGGAFYHQERIGRHGAPFRLHKFRSMQVHREGAQVTLGTSDPRITSVGRVLRKYKLDELPQLWNVVKGDMSLVGPRPEVAKYVALYTDEMREVLTIRPGLTDPASIAGFDEGERLEAADDPEQHYREVILPEKVAQQLAYVRSATFGSDIRIIARTLFRIFKR
ncbi:MAG TPA: sugar transferase [Flavobacteriales bacterium]|nr:sugar transferase [Flavobacteriales bacterium]|tara:strand:- start:1039 stop:1626 length:588 start_codon:yes stop_codon:yes gene_type:complete